MRDYDATVKNLREAAKGLLFDAMPYRASVMEDAAEMSEYSNSSILSADIPIYDECERHDNCVVEVWRNSVTGEVSVGWWPNEEEGDENS